MSASQLRDCFQKVRMTHAMKSIHAKTETCQHLAFHVQFIDGQNARNIFLWRAETCFVTAHQTIRAAIDENDCIDSQIFNHSLVTSEQWLHASPLETINRNLLSLLAKPFCQESLWKIISQHGR